MSDVRLPTARLAIAVLVCLAAHAFPSFIPSLKGGISSTKDAANSSAPAEAVAVSTHYLSLRSADEKALSLRAQLASKIMGSDFKSAETLITRHLQVTRAMLKRCISGRSFGGDREVSVHPARTPARRWPLRLGIVIAA